MCKYQDFLYLNWNEKYLTENYSNHLLQLNLWRCFKEFKKYCHLLMWPNRTQCYFHMIHKVTYKKCKQISYQWDPCFSRPAPNLFRVVQTVVTISENHNKCMAVRKLDTKHHPSSTCSQNVNFCMDTMLMCHFLNLEC